MAPPALLARKGPCQRRPIRGIVEHAELRYVALMSLKQQLAKAVTDLPDGLSLEQAMARLYRAFKLKQLLGSPVRQSPPELSGTLQIHGDILSPALDPEAWNMCR